MGILISSDSNTVPIQWMLKVGLAHKIEVFYPSDSAEYSTESKIPERLIIFAI